MTSWSSSTKQPAFWCTKSYKGIGKDPKRTNSTTTARTRLWKSPQYKDSSKDVAQGSWEERQQTDGLPTPDAHLWTKVLVRSGSLRLQKLQYFLTTVFQHWFPKVKRDSKMSVCNIAWENLWVGTLQLNITQQTTAHSPGFICTNILKIQNIADNPCWHLNLIQSIQK